ncbi:MAG TPA: hypothetical protein VHG90_03590 [Acidimicrobiales bacterium]|nr:hypothetical protein [Acidimicrobiales bacterium]
MRRGPLVGLVFLLVAASLVWAGAPAFADHSRPVVTYSPKEGPEGTVISFTVAGCKEAAQGPQGRPETDLTISLFPSSFGGGDQRHFDIGEDDEQVSGTFTVRTRAQYAASASGFDGRTLSLAAVCWEGGDMVFGGEFIITDAPAAAPAPSPAPAPVAPAPAASPDTESQAQVSDATVTPGEQVTVTGGGFAPNRDLRIDMDSDPVFLGTTRSDAGGRFTATVTIPLNASPGAHRIVVSGPGPGGGTHRSIATVNVVVTVGRPLARTGGTSAGLLRLAIVFTLAGMVLLVGAGHRARTIALGRASRPVRPRGGIVWRAGRARRWPPI